MAIRMTEEEAIAAGYTYSGITWRMINFIDYADSIKEPYVGADYILVTETWQDDLTKEKHDKLDRDGKPLDAIYGNKLFNYAMYFDQANVEWYLKERHFELLEDLKGTYEQKVAEENAHYAYEQERYDSLMKAKK